ncbi:Enoyl-CoA hydratase [Cupriavidus taiwanensis]|uniref:enoyl-CoA hydratase/isomerase family protein n=1 Tax=Cupriavidus taiwanensis TaxID=164546 RepID=UPI000E1526CC|nr:enoyl-CoA hydratase/isomerase family protein [Cupriavidus taiwanensis]SOZ30888.1 Enoyl-CoA hydratase [Cupriavidus taiwanensis]
MSSAAEIHVTRDGHVARVVLSRPPHNFVDAEVMRRLAETLLALDHDHHCRAIVLASGVGAFCAGADFSGSGQGEVASDPAAFYTHAMKLYRNRKPIVAAVAGAAIGAGQQAALLFYTGRRITGTEAAGIGLADQLVARDEVDASAMALAQEIAASAPLAVETTRATLREGLADRIAEVNQRELAIQRGQFRSEDFREGVAAMAGRRAPVFQRR